MKTNKEIIQELRRNYELQKASVGCDVSLSTAIKEVLAQTDKFWKEELEKHKLAYKGAKIVHDREKKNWKEKMIEVLESAPLGLMKGIDPHCSGFNKCARLIIEWQQKQINKLKDE